MYKTNIKKEKHPIIQTGTVYYILANFLCILAVVLTIIRMLKGYKSGELMFSLGCDSLGICVVSFMIHSCLRNKVHSIKNDDIENIKFGKFLFCVLIALFADLVIWIIDGIDTKLFIALNYLYNVVYHMVTILSIYLFVDYLKEQKWIKNKVASIYQKIFWIYFISLGICFIINIFDPFIFYFENGYYTRTDASLIFFVIDGLLYIAILLIIKYKEVTNRQLYLILYYVGLPFLTIALQAFVMNVALFSCGLVISTTIIFVLDYNVKQFQLLNAYKENENNRSRLMLSQIQPHFIYNILSTISYLCKTDPDQAQELIVKFSQYLRSNIDFKSQDNLIPFSKELESVKNYIDIEKIRFGERIDVQYEIEATNFTVPMLTLQPIVENAVKHGIRQKKDGGSILISTFEDDLYYHLLVKDNGVGFDLEEIKNDGKIHVGLKNVTERIEHISNGTVIIQSEKGRGTNILINIPKGKEK